MQLTPTASWWFKIGTNDPFMKVISLHDVDVQVLPSPLWFGWSSMREHWAIDANIDDLAATLGVSSVALTPHQIVVSKNHASGFNEPPTQDLIDDAGDVANPQKFRFQIKAKSVVYQNDWGTGEPPTGSGMKIFYQKTGAIDDKSPRLLLELTTEDKPKNLARITWLVRERHEGYEQGFTLERKEPPTDWKDWFYYSVETVY